MAYNGSGVWNRLYSWVNDAANNVKITASRMDAEMNDMTTNGFGNVITRDGQGQPTANLPMAGHKHTGAAAAATSGDYLVYGQNAASLGSVTVSAANDGTSVSTVTNTTTTNVGTPNSGVIDLHFTSLNSGDNAYFVKCTNATGVVAKIANSGAITCAALTGAAVADGSAAHTLSNITTTNVGTPNSTVLALSFANFNSGDAAAFLKGSNTTGLMVNIANNGNITNINNSYGAISDRNLKENISLASSQWDDIKAIGGIVSKFSLKSDHSHQIQLGLIAQDLQVVSPGLVSEEDGILGVKYSVLYMKAVKALGEVLVRVEALEALPR